MLYFAYGSKTHPEELHKYCPKAKFHSLYELKGYTLVFEGYSIGYGLTGTANIRRSPGSSVWGVLWDIPEDELALLDADEGAHTEYEPGPHNEYERVRFTLEDGTPFFLYYLVKPHVKNRPCLKYYMELLKGYSHFDLDLKQLRKAYRESSI